MKKLTVLLTAVTMILMMNICTMNVFAADKCMCDDCDCAEISGHSFQLESEDFVYSGKACEPKIVSDLKEGTDFTVKFENNIESGIAKVTITGKGIYIGETSRTFMIEPGILGDDDFKLEFESVKYDGNAKAPAVISSLEENRDYMVTYENNIEEGTAKVIIKGDGCNCQGTVTKTFKIASH